MLDEYGEPTDAQLLDWREHNDHADGTAGDPEEREAWDALREAGRWPGEPVGALVAAPVTMAVAFVLADGRRIEAAMLMPAGAIVRRFEITAGGQPVVALPFAIHDDGRRYHTVCRRLEPEIDEWAI